MDSRITLNVNETFLETLETSFQQKEKVRLLIDNNGMTRTEGFINAIHKNASGISIEMDNGSRIDLKTIIAVNGIFRPEYGEC